jgi:hypothetical protein
MIRGSFRTLARKKVGDVIDIIVNDMKLKAKIIKVKLETDPKLTHPAYNCYFEEVR